MSDRIMTSDLLVDLSAEKQQLLTGGQNFGNGGFGDEGLNGSDFDSFDEGGFRSNGSRGIRLRRGGLRLNGGGDFGGGGFSDRKQGTCVKITIYTN